MQTHPPPPKKKRKKDKNEKHSAIKSKVGHIHLKDCNIWDVIDTSFVLIRANLIIPAVPTLLPT